MVLECPTFVFGSRTGAGDLDILAMSERLGPEITDRIKSYCHIAPRLVRSESWPDITAFYSIGGGLHVLARTRYLERGRRGADYIVSGVILNRKALGALEWSVFGLLSDPFFDRREKPRGITPFRIDPDRHGQLCQLPSAGGEELSVVAPVIAAMAKAPLGMLLNGKNEADPLNLCLLIQRLLPIEDRMAFSFCTREAFARKLDYRLSLYRAEDEAAVKRERPDLARVRFGTDLNGIGKAYLPAISAWCDLVAQGFPSIWSLSLLNAPATGVSTAQLAQSHHIESTSQINGESPNRHIKAAILRADSDPRNEGRAGLKGDPVAALIHHLKDEFIGTAFTESSGQWKRFMDLAADPKLWRLAGLGDNVDPRQIAVVGRNMRGLLTDVDNAQAAAAASTAMLLVKGRGRLRSLVGQGDDKLFDVSEFTLWITYLVRRSQTLAVGSLAAIFSNYPVAERKTVVAGVLSKLAQAKAPERKIADAVILALASAAQEHGDPSRRGEATWAQECADVFNGLDPAQPLFTPMVGARVALESECMAQGLLDLPMVSAMAEEIATLVHHRPRKLSQISHRNVALRVIKHCLEADPKGSGEAVLRNLTVAALLLFKKWVDMRLKGPRDEDRPFYKLGDVLIEKSFVWFGNRQGHKDQYDVLLQTYLRELAATSDTRVETTCFIADQVIGVFVSWPGRKNAEGDKHGNEEQQRKVARILSSLSRIIERSLGQDCAAEFWARLDRIEKQYRRDLSERDLSEKDLSEAQDIAALLNYLNAELGRGFIEETAADCGHPVRDRSLPKRRVAAR